jgi:hypothetical protein
MPASARPAAATSPRCCATTTCRSPDAQTTHVRLERGRLPHPLGTAHRVRDLDLLAPVRRRRASARQEPATALQAVPQDWLAALPGQSLAALHLWVLPGRPQDDALLTPHVLREDTLVGSIGRRRPRPRVHRFRAARRRLVAHGAAGGPACRRAGSAGWCSGCWRSTPTAWRRCWGCPPRANVLALLAAAEGELAALAEAIRAPARTRSRSCWTR